MPKGVEFSSNATTLLPPPAKSPPPKPRAEGEQSFEHALKKAQPKAKPAPASKNDAPVDEADVEPKNDAQPAPTKDASSPAPDDDKPVDPGAEHVDESEAPKKPAAVETDAAPVVAQAVAIPDAQLPVTQSPKADATEAAEQLPIASQAVDVPPTVEKALNESADVAGGDQPVAPVAVKAAANPNGDTNGDPAPTDLPETAHIDKPAPRQAVKKLPQNVLSHETEATDEAAAPVDDESPAVPEVAQASEPAAKSVALPVARQQKDVPEQDAPAPEIASAPKVNLKPKQTATTDGEPLPQFQAAENITDGDQPHHDSTALTADIQSIVDAPTPKAPAPTVAQAQVTAPQPPVRPEQDFAATNHDRIVAGVKTELLPNGGTMRLRLDPPDLGPLQVSVRMVDGAMTASFETSSDQATRLLSHSLSQLKTALETTGVSVERLHVEQAPRDQQSGSSDPESQRRDSQQQQDGARRDQQRREMLNRMWRRLTVGRDPLDMVA